MVRLVHLVCVVSLFPTLPLPASTVSAALARLTSNQREPKGRALVVGINRASAIPESKSATAFMNGGRVRYFAPAANQDSHRKRIPTATKVGVTRDRVLVSSAPVQQSTTSRRIRPTAQPTLELGARERANELRWRFTQQQRARFAQDQSKLVLDKQEPAMVGRETMPSLPDLRFAENDARAVAKALSSLGYESTLLIGQEATAVQIRRSLEEIVKQSSRGPVVFYFSGHGAAFDGETLLLTSGSSTYDPLNITLQEIKRILAQSPASGVVVMDACRFQIVDSPSGWNESFLEAEGAIPSIFSSSLGAASFEYPDVQHGIFTHEFLHALGGDAADSSGQITLGGLKKFLARRVPQASELRGRLQIPQFEGFSGNFRLAQLDPSRRGRDGSRSGRDSGGVSTSRSELEAKKADRKGRNSPGGGDTPIQTAETLDRVEALRLYDAWDQDGSLEAFDLLVERYPNQPLAQVARARAKESARSRGPGPIQGEPGPVANPTVPTWILAVLLAFIGILVSAIGIIAGANVWLLKFVTDLVKPAVKIHRP